MELKEAELELHHITKTLTDKKKTLLSKTKLISELEEGSQVTSLANSILELYLESVSNSVSGTLEELMGSAMQVLNMDVEVGLVYREGARGGYSLSIKQGEVEGTLESFGGGVLSLVSFIMLVSTIVLKEKRRFIVLDESLNAVSFVYQEPLSNFMRQLCDDFGFDILLISHQPELDTHASSQYLVTKGNKGTKITLKD